MRAVKVFASRGSSFSLTLAFVLSVFIFLTLVTNETFAENPYKNEKKFRFFNSWKAPEIIRKNFTYYLSGHDYADRPVWIIELGRWNFKSLLEGDVKDAISTFESFTEQLLFRLHNSPQKFQRKEKQTQEQEIDSVQTTDKSRLDQVTNEFEHDEIERSSDGWVLIIDMEGYDLEQLFSAGAIQFSLRLASKLEIAAQNMEYGLIINANYVADRFINLLRPLLGSTYSKFEAFGTQKSIWMPKVLKKIPIDQISESYGGTKDFKPVAVFG